MDGRVVCVQYQSWCALPWRRSNRELSGIPGHHIVWSDSVWNSLSLCDSSSSNIIIGSSNCSSNTFGPMISISRFVHMRVCLCVSVCLSVCVFTFEIPFKHLWAPTSQIRMSKIFRGSEYLGKSNGKKWSPIWKFLLIKGVRLPPPKS